MEFINNLPKKDEDALTALLQHCAMDELEGTLIAKGSRSLPRKSIAEFAWVVGVPDKVRTETYFHVRYAKELSGEGEDKASQPIFHRPASSGIYASVATFELARIGLNDISQEYVLDESERLTRYQSLLKSVLFTYVEPSGAMRGTQNPHILNFEGVVTYSHSVLPAPTISPLAEDYKEQVKAISQALDGNGLLKTHEYANTAEFTGILQDIIHGTRPYRLFGEKGV